MFIYKYSLNFIDLQAVYKTTELFLNRYISNQQSALFENEINFSEEKSK